MTLFVIAAVALICLSGLFFLWPFSRKAEQEQDSQHANLEWYQQRQREIADEGTDALAEDAQLRLLEDTQQAANVPPTVRRNFPSWTLLPIVAVMSAGLYYWLGAAPDVMISRQLTALEADSSPLQIQRLMSAIESRSVQRPDNLEYLNLLGRYYMGQEAYREAADAYGQMVAALPEDAYALALAAQASYMAAGRDLDENTRLLAEQSLALDPHQRTALGLLGMASFEQQEYRAAINYWERLLVMEQPGSEGAQMIASVIATARQRLGEPNPAAVAVTAAAESENPQSLSPGVTVHVALPQNADIASTDTVFVLARNAESDSRMPIAVRRLQAAQLPMTLRLDDSYSMAGQTLSSAESVVVVVQVSPQGTPGEANATWLGKGGPVPPTLDSAPLEIVLEPRG
ncbi:MAG: c-type cytochrome biogenesis protein CcmI [Pseudomonadota bacterium]